MRKAMVTAAVSLVLFGWGVGKAMAVCGNGVVDSGEECDEGGQCIGSPNAGAACTSDADCQGGTCRVFGGQPIGGGPGSCASNCTIESEVLFQLVPGELDELELRPGTSGVSIASDFLTLPLPLQGLCLEGELAGDPCLTNEECGEGGVCSDPPVQRFTIGKRRDGRIPLVVKASSVEYPGIPVSTLACGCVHGVATKTCGGTFQEPDGSLSPDCSEGFSEGESVCDGLLPCAYLHGAGNTASGEIGCDGLEGVNLNYEVDSATGAQSITLTGSGPSGSAVVLQTLGITAVLGRCQGNDPATYGPDGILCTDDDPEGGLLAIAGTLPAVTGQASAVVKNANGTTDDLGPVTATGVPFECYALECGELSTAAGGGVVGAFALADIEVIGDVAISAQLFSEGDLPDPSECPSTGECTCVGDCDGNGEVTVNELIAMVAISLGNAPLSACECGDANGDGEIIINEIISAVNNALGVCS